MEPSRVFERADTRAGHLARQEPRTSPGESALSPDEGTLSPAARGRHPGGHSLSRRGFFAAAGLAGSATTLTSMTGAGPARASVRMRQPVRQGGTLPRSQAGAGLVGSTVATRVYPKATDRVSAAEIFDKYVGLPSAMAVQKCFFNEGVLPNFVSANIYRLTVAGCKLIMCFRPSRKLTQSQRNKLKKTCELYLSRGVNFDVVLWQEANDLGGNFFPDGAAYVAYHEYYRPYVPAGIQVIYDAGGNYPDYQQAFYPGDDQVDMVYCDIYCSAWVKGRTLDTIMGIADGASPPKPFGIGEFGLSATGRNLPSHSQYDRFITYLTNTLTGRLSHGKQNGDVMYFDGVDTTTPWNTITGPSDWKTPFYQNLYKALRRG